MIVYTLSLHQKLLQRSLLENSAVRCCSQPTGQKSLTKAKSTLYFSFEIDI